MMKLNKKWPRLIVAAVATVSVTGCSDIAGLEEEPKTFLTPDQLFRDDASAAMALRGVYEPLQGWNGWKQPAQHVVMCDDNQMFCWDWMAGGPSGNWSGHWTLQNNSTYFGDYQIIERANQVLQYLPEAKGVSEAMKQTAEGQALFARAYAYFDLVRRFGGVPLRTQAYVPNPEMGAQERAPLADVYNQIAPDLTRAAEVLPVSYAQPNGQGLPRKASANGLLAKVYLHMAGDEARGTPLEANRREYLQKAKEAAQRAMQDPSTRLEADYMNLFDVVRQETSPEILFAVQGGRANNAGSNVPPFFSPRGDLTIVGGGGQGFVSIREDFYRTFAPGDKRVEPNKAIARSWEVSQTQFGKVPAIHADSLAILKDKGLVVQDSIAAYSSWSNTCGSHQHNFHKLVIQDPANPGQTRTGIFAVARPVYSLKYIDRNHSGSEYGNENNFIILRYADVLLIFAEAENELNGPTGPAYAAINEVRKRAGLPNLQPGLGQAEFRQAVWREREHELYGEFQARFDLVRQGRYLTEMNKSSSVYPQHGQCRKRQEFQKLYPIPARELAANPKIKQNPGY